MFVFSLAVYMILKGRSNRICELIPKYHCVIVHFLQMILKYESCVGISAHRSQYCIINIIVYAMEPSKTTINANGIARKKVVCH